MHLEAAYEDFKNPNAEKYCDFRNLAGAAIDYLQHKFPEWGKDVELPENAFDPLKENLNRWIENTLKEIKEGN